MFILILWSICYNILIHILKRLKMTEKTYTTDAYNKSHENYGISLQIDTPVLKEKKLANDGICSITKKI